MSPVLGLVLLVTSAACRDDAAVAPANARSTAIDSVAARATLERVNPFQWVGRQHNAMLDTIRAAYRRGDLAGRNACAELATIDIDAVVPEAYRRQSTRAQRDAALRLGIGLTPCGNPAVSPQGEATVSPRAANILRTIQDIVRSARTAGEVAVGLAPQVTAATQLDQRERDIIMIAAAVAQSSSEYWETHWLGFVADVKAQYGRCLAGATNVHACSRASEASGTAVTLGAARSDGCPFTGSYSDIWEADVKGATSGALGGLVAGPEGAVIGGLVAGGGSSAGLALWGGIMLAFCSN